MSRSAPTNARSKGEAALFSIGVQLVSSSEVPKQGPSRINHCRTPQMLEPAFSRRFQIFEARRVVVRHQSLMCVGLVMGAMGG
jgi:hypothetical protein